MKEGREHARDLGLDRLQLKTSSSRKPKSHSLSPTAAVSLVRTSSESSFSPSSSPSLQAEFRRLLGQHTVSLSLEHRLTRSEQQTHPSARTTPGSWRRSSLSFWPLFSCGMEVSLEGCRLQSGHGKDRSPPCARWDVVPGTLHDPAISFYFVLE